MEVFGTDYPTPDGTCVRDYIHVTDLVARPYRCARATCARGGDSLICNCGYARAIRCCEVIETVKRVSGVDFPVEPVARRAGDPAAIVAANDRIAGARLAPKHDDLDGSSARRWTGSAVFPRRSLPDAAV